MFSVNPADKYLYLLYYNVHRVFIKMSRRHNIVPFIILFSFLVPCFHGICMESGIRNDSTMDAIVLHYDFPTPNIETILIDEAFSHKITLGDLPITQRTNQPCLPVKPLRILLPNGFTVEDIHVEVTEPPVIVSSIHPIRGAPVISLQDLSNDLTIPSYPQVASDELYSAIGLYEIRGYVILYINLHPVIYDEGVYQLKYYPSMNVRVDTTQTSRSRTVRDVQNDRTLVGSIVENPEMIQSYDSSIDQSYTGQEASYLLITNERLANSGMQVTFNQLIQSKIDKGLSARIITVEEILSDDSFSVNGTWGDNNPSNPFYTTMLTTNYSRFDDTQARIRNYIRFAYVTLGTEYVLLGGDADINNETHNIIPARGLFANESGLPLLSTTMLLDEEEDDIPSDIYYACLDGNFNHDMDEHFGESKDRNEVAFIDEADLLSEVSVGRACVDSEEEVSHFVRKTLAYEQTIDSPHLRKILFLGEYLGFPGISAYGGNYKDLVKPYVPSSYNIETLYDRDLPYSWNKYDLIEIINNGTPHIINHDGHAYYGYNLKMHNADVDSLTNTNYFFLYSHGCMAGGFDNPLGYDCIAERLTVETPYGAFAAILNARYGLGSENSLDSPSLALDISFFKALFTENIRQIGPANHFSKEDHVWQIDENGIRWVFYETNLFGDPEISIHDSSVTPIEISVEIQTPEPGGNVYIKDKKIFSLSFLKQPFLLGPCTITVDAYSIPAGYVQSVEFFVDTISVHKDTNVPYEWYIDTPLKGSYNLTVIAHGRYGEQASSSMQFYAWVR